MYTYTHTQASSTQASLHPTSLTAQTKSARLLPQVAQKQYSHFCVEPALSQHIGSRLVLQLPDSPCRTEFTTSGSVEALQVTRVTPRETHCFYRLGSKCLDPPGAHSFGSTDIPICRGNSRSKGTVELKEFKLDTFRHSEGTGMEMNPILWTVSPNFPHRHS